MSKPGLLEKHGIVRNAIRVDMLQFGLPFFAVFAVGIVLSAKGGGLESLWPTIWRVIREPASFFALSVERATGLILFVGGLTVMLVAQFTLWRNYAATLVIREDHQLIQHGIYRLVRHPIYLGVVIVVFGIPVYTSSLSGLLTMVALIPILLNRIRLEEGLLIEAFGDAYRKYRATTSKLIPFIH